MGLAFGEEPRIAKCLQLLRVFIVEEILHLDSISAEGDRVVDATVLGHVLRVELLIAELLNNAQFLSSEVAHSDALDLVIDLAMEPCTRRAREHSIISDDISSALHSQWGVLTFLPQSAHFLLSGSFLNYYKSYASFLFIFKSE